MRLSAEDCLREFMETLPPEYRKLSLQKLRHICFSPWAFLRKEFQSGYLPEIRFRYFGVFRVSEKMALYELQKSEIRFAKGYITEEEYYRIKTMVDNLIKRNNNESE